MWDSIDKENYKIFVNTNIDLMLKIIKVENHHEIHINYKGYNIAFPMEVWGFGSACEEWGIREKLEGDPVKDPANIFFVIEIADTRAFMDLIYFFITENNADGMLREECQANWSE